MYKLVCYDIDKTLAPLNEPIPEDVIAQLKEIQKYDVKILLISGKPSAYISGIIRQTGLKNVIVSGGNGEVLNSDYTYPPTYQLNHNIQPDLIKILFQLKMSLMDTFKNEIWIQPNEFQVTPFHYEKPEIIEALRNFIHNFLKEQDSTHQIKIYEHSDCFDILPNIISKGNIIKALADLEGISLKEVISVGDSVNDESMFNVTGYSIGVSTSYTLKVTKRFETIYEANQHIIERIKR
ncbi:MAG: HAD family phosphatase [Clostridia bacterium]|nr:HAD family phosphatase [Clostridia bacterium]